MRSRSAVLAAVVVNAAQLAGLALVTAGIAEVYRPAALIFAGVSLVAAGWLHGGQA